MWKIENQPEYVLDEKFVHFEEEAFKNKQQKHRKKITLFLRWP